MKIKTNRSWGLKIERFNDCVEIIEEHECCDDNHMPYISIPVESIDDVIYRLMQFKRRIKKGD